jgi:hypothetical protein
MRNPNFVRVPPPVVSTPRLNALEALVTAHLAANAARSDIDDSEIIALAPEFAATPGTLKAIKDRLNLS